MIEADAEEGVHVLITQPGEENMGNAITTELEEKFLELEAVTQVDEGDKATLHVKGTGGRLTREDETGGTMLVDARNGYSKLRCLTILWTVRHQWQVVARSVFNCYKH